MEVHFTPEQEARLAQLASHNGTEAEQLVKKATINMLEDGERFRAAVRERIAAADRSEFVDHEEVWTNIEKILRT
jgi:predicted transcriptional regulator